MSHVCQRWRDRQDRWRPSGEIINTDDYGVRVIPHREARAFVEGHHYSGSYPADRVRVGLMRKRGPGPGELVGVAIFSVPAQRRAIPSWCGVPSSHGVELGRFVLLDDVPGNGETWFLARAFSALQAELPEIRAVLSYSDPMPRQDASGRLVMPGHVGTIYQAHNGLYRGRSSARTLYLDRRGRIMSPRTMSKLRGGERGADGAYQQLLEAGAPPRGFGEPPREYLARALASEAFTRFRHRGNHAYVWGLDRATLRALRATPSAPYPKAADHILGQVPLSLS